MEILIARIMMQSSTVHSHEDQTWLSYSWHSIHHSMHKLRGNGQRVRNDTARLMVSKGGRVHGVAKESKQITLHSLL